MFDNFQNFIRINNIIWTVQNCERLQLDWDNEILTPEEKKLVDCYLEKWHGEIEWIELMDIYGFIEGVASCPKFQTV